MYWLFAAIDIAIRIAAFRRTRRLAFGWYLAFTIPGEIACYWLGWTHRPGSFLYDYFWRSYEIASLMGLALVAREAVGCRWNRQGSAKVSRGEALRDMEVRPINRNVWNQRRGS